MTEIEKRLALDVSRLEYEKADLLHKLQIAEEMYFKLYKEFEHVEYKLKLMENNR